MKCLFLKIVSHKSKETKTLTEIEFSYTPLEDNAADLHLEMSPVFALHIKVCSGHWFPQSINIFWKDVS